MEKENMMDFLINELIDNKGKIFSKLKSRRNDVERYFYIKKEFQKGDILNNLEFQRVYKKFYVMYMGGLTQKFFEEYFKILSSRETDLKKILNKLYEIPRKNKTKAVHFSFVTKLLHTINNSLPIYDSLVGRAFGLKIEGQDKDARINSCLEVYEKLNLYYKELLSNDKIKKIISDFRKKFDCDNKKISDTKILDFLIWANGQL